MEELNPYDSPPADAGVISRRRGTALGILSEAWQLYVGNFALIAALVVVVWAPCELFSSYMDYHVFGPDEFRRSFQLAQFLETFIGIIATAAVIYVGVSVTEQQESGFGRALAAGLASWPRMWWTRVLTGFVTVLCLLLLVIPGIYVAVRLSLADSVVVAENLSGTNAMRRSFELTRDHFWLVFRLLLVLLLLLLVCMALLIFPIIIFEDLDSWLLDAFTQLVADVILAFGTLCIYCAYRDLQGAVVDRQVVA